MFSPQIHVMDFATCAEECRLYIDGLFQALSDFSFESPMFSGDCVGPDSRLVFASVALFDSKLPAQFQPSRGWFRDACGSASAVRTLRRLGAPYRTARCDDIAVTLLEVPYNSPLLESLVVFLPDSPFGGLASLERSLSKDKIMVCLDRLEQRGLVDVTLPRLRLCCATDFARLLPAMGVRDAFGDAADFSDMTGAGAAGRLKVSAAKHFAVFRLGLRSAAARSEARFDRSSAHRRLCGRPQPGVHGGPTLPCFWCSARTPAASSSWARSPNQASRVACHVLRDPGRFPDASSRRPCAGSRVVHLPAAFYSPRVTHEPGAAIFVAARSVYFPRNFNSVTFVILVI
ncbi:hypothetical protein MRX96_040995 [Rhipicephalus microplus]